MASIYMPWVSLRAPWTGWSVATTTTDRGTVIFVAGLLAVVAFVVHRRLGYLVALIAALAVEWVAIADLVDIVRAMSEGALMFVRPGWGLWVVILVGLVVGTLAVVVGHGIADPAAD